MEGYAKDMGDPAINRFRNVTPHVPVTSLRGDEFLNQNSEYQAWRPSGSGDWLMIYTASGAGVITMNSKEHLLKVGEAVLFEPKASQDYRTDPRHGSWGLIWVHFMPLPHWRLWLKWKSMGTGVSWASLPKGALRVNFVSSLKKAIARQRHQTSFSNALAMNALEEALLWGSHANAQQTGAGYDPRIQKAIDYLTEKSAFPFRVEELARHCGLSASRFAHLFKAQTGSSPQQIWEKIRMDRAAFLLTSSHLSIAEISEQVGYEDVFYFSNRFLKQRGLRPSAYRKQFKTGRGD